MRINQISGAFNLLGPCVDIVPVDIPWYIIEHIAAFIRTPLFVWIPPGVTGDFHQQIASQIDRDDQAAQALEGGSDGRERRLLALVYGEVGAKVGRGDAEERRELEVRGE